MISADVYKPLFKAFYHTKGGLFLNKNTLKDFYKGFTPKRVGGKPIMKLKMNKKGQIFGQLVQLGVGLATLVIVMAVVFLIMSNVRNNAQVAADANATAATNTLITATSTIPGFVPLIVITVIGGILIGLVSLFGRQG